MCSRPSFFARGAEMRVPTRLFGPSPRRIHGEDFGAVMTTSASAWTV
jgi:hypothetical protein